MTAQFSQSSYANSAVQSFIQRVYQWMGVGLGLTGVIAWWASKTPAVIQAMTGGAFWVLIIVELGIVWWLSSSITKIKPTTAILGFAVYSAINGLTLSILFLVYTGASIASTFFICSGTFVATSIFGWVTKRDLTGMGAMLRMALIGLLIALVVNLFLRSPLLDFGLSLFGVALFIGLTAYDTQWLKRIHQESPDAPEQLAVMGALKLYLDFINMFIFMLRLFGQRR